MKKFLSGLRGKTLFFLFLFTAALSQTSCHRPPGKGHGGPVTNHVDNWLNWNYVFKEGTDSATRQRTINEISNAINSVASDTSKQRPAARLYNSRQVTIHPLTSYLSSYLSRIIQKNNGFSLDNAEVHFCSCHDSLLWNVTANLTIGGSGQSAPSSPPPNGPGPSGDAIDIVDSNGSVTPPSSLPAVLNPSGLVKIEGAPEVTSDITLGIIDTGVDPDLFSPGLFSKLFASDGSATISFVPGAPSTAFKDDDGVRHGTAVAAIALDAFYQQSVKDGKHLLPRLMALKVLDKDGHGTTLSVSCALSYAVRHKVTVINASLGYWNTQDQVINRYLRLTAKHSIPVVAAAGNDPGVHDTTLCSSALIGHNRLGRGHLFFPACQSGDLQYCIVSVAGLSSPYWPCRYQNYSSDYVSIGVVNNVPSPLTPGHNTCCGFALPFINDHFVLDGSSFATPVVSGRLAYKILSNGRRNTAVDYVQLLTPTPTAGSVLTRSGFYITY